MSNEEKPHKSLCRVEEERLRVIMRGEATPDVEEIVDLAFDALLQGQLLHSANARIQQLEDRLAAVEARRGVLPALGRPPVPLATRERVKEAWAAAAPGPWQVWSQQPDVSLLRFEEKDGQQLKRMVGTFDPFDSNGVFDACACSLAREHMVELIADLEVLEARLEKAGG